MFEMPDVEISRNPRGYYTLYIDGKFAGNFDTFGEAVDEYYALREAS